MEVDRIQACHHQNAGEQAINFEFCRQRSRQCAGQKAAGKTSSRCEQRINISNDEHRSQRGAEGTRPVCSNIGEGEDSKADKNAQRDQRKDESQGERSQQKTHASAPSTVMLEIGAIQHAPRTSSLSPPPDMARSSLSK